MAVFNRVQRIVVPILRGDDRLSGVNITTWVPDIDYRDFPILNVRRIGGSRNRDAPHLHANPIIELAAYSNESLIACEDLYETALDVLYDAVSNQVATDAGYIQSIFETMGATQFSSMFQDSWRVQGLIKLSVRGHR